MACPALKTETFTTAPLLQVQSAQEGYTVQVCDKGQPTYGQVYDWLFDNGYVARMSGVAFKVYGALARFKNKAHQSWPGQRKLAEMCGCSLRDVRPALDELVGLGLITIEQVGQGKRPTRYRMYALPKGQIMYRPKFKPDKNERGLFDGPGESGPAVSVTTDVVSVTTDSLGQQSVSGDDSGSYGNKRSECLGNETKDYPTGNPTNLLSFENREKLQKKIQRAERHIHEVNPRLRQRLRYDDLRELCRVYEGNDLAAVIAKYGDKAENIGLIRHYLADYPTIEDREQAKLAKLRKRERAARELEEDKAKACTPEVAKRYIEQLKAIVSGRSDLKSSPEQPL